MNFKFRILNYELLLVVLTIDVNMRTISSEDFSHSYAFNSAKSLLSSSRNQYRDSLASFDAIDIFEMKSLRDCAAIASSTLAAMLVPLRNNCFERTYSFSLIRILYSLIISKAKLKLLSYIIFSFFMIIEFKLRLYIVRQNRSLFLTL